MITLQEILNIPKEEINNTKVKFNSWNGQDDPIEVYKVNPDKINVEWLLWRNKVKYYQVGQLAVCLAQIRGDFWLLASIKRITKDLNLEKAVSYEAEELEEYAHFYGRIVVKYHRTNRAVCMYYKTLLEDLEVSQILPEMFDDDDFPGYDRVCVSYQKLKSVLERGKKDWIAALKSQKAVYLITDTKTGKLYVGSATSDKGMLLQRWSNYISDGHGGNKELFELVKEKGLSYVEKYFQYTIIENFNSKIDDHVILERESYWKTVLKTREFGYNSN